MGRACKISSAVIGVLLIAGGVVLLVGKYPEKLINNEINKQLVISMDSPVYDDWINPPPPIYMQYWIYNVTNPDEVIEGKKANLTQIGPYTYRLYQPRYNVIFYQNDTVSYQYNHTLVFQRDQSVGWDDQDNVTALNVPLVTVASMLENIPNWAKSLVRELIKHLKDSHLFIQLTPKQLLFGYEDPLLKLAHQVLSLIGKDFPAEFGAFYGFNNTDDGVYLIRTGRDNISKTNNIEKWNSERYLPYWNTNYANALNGTDGVFFYPRMDTNNTVYVYSTDICRSLPFAFEKKTSVKDIGSFRFHTTEKAFGNVSINPDNADFCIPPGNCLDSGVLNISVCKQNAPVIISTPHFYQGAEQYVHGVNGLNPQKSQHETFLDIEPTTGTVLRANKRLQVNVYLKESEFSKQMHNVRTTVFPFLWLNESVTIDNDSASRLRGVFTLKRFVLSTPYILFAIAALIFLVLVVVACRQRKEYSRLLDNDVGASQDDEPGTCKDTVKT